MTIDDLKFLKQLSTHNDRDWFQKHRPAFDAAQAHFLELVSGLVFALSEYDEALTSVDPKSCVFRIYRDVRFSKNKAPYKNHLAAFICAGGRKSNTVPGFYIHIEPAGKSIFGAGYYMPEKEILDNLRQDLASTNSNIAAKLKEKSFRKIFPEIVDDDKAKKVPRGFDKDHVNAELLKLKHFFVHAHLTDQQICSRTVLAVLAKQGKLLHHWNTMLFEIARR